MQSLNPPLLIEAISQLSERAKAAALLIKNLDGRHLRVCHQKPAVCRVEGKGSWKPHAVPAQLAAPLPGGAEELDPVLPASQDGDLLVNHGDRHRFPGGLR